MEIYGGRLVFKIQVTAVIIPVKGILFENENVWLLFGTIRRRLITNMQSQWHFGNYSEIYILHSLTNKS